MGWGRHLQRDGDGVGPSQPLGLSPLLELHGPHFRPVVNDLKADAQVLPSDVAWGPGSWRGVDALVLVLGDKVVAALSLVGEVRDGRYHQRGGGVKSPSGEGGKGVVSFLRGPAGIPREEEDNQQ